MSPHYRTALRASLRLAISVDPYFSGITVLRSWAKNIDDSLLPMLAVMTPGETKDEAAHGAADRTINVTIVLRRPGGEDLEDQLDLDSAEIERLVLAELRTQGFGPMLEATETVFDGAAERRIGTLVASFRVLLTTIEPLSL